MNGEWNLKMRTSSSTTSMMTAAAHYTKPLLNSLAKYFLCSPHPSPLHIHHSQIDVMIRLEKAVKKKMIWLKNLVLFPRWGRLTLRSKTMCHLLEKDFPNFLQPSFRIFVSGFFFQPEKLPTISWSFIFSILPLSRYAKKLFLATLEMVIWQFLKLT